MDPNHFDTLTRALTSAHSRRGALATALAGVLATLGADHIAAKKKACPPCKKRKTGKCKGTLPDGAGCKGGTCQGGKCVAQCANRRKDGSESDVDCGGTCPRCLNGRTCSNRADCASALCSNGMCQACTASPECGTDTSGPCSCSQPATGGPKVCTGTAVPPTVQSCDACPTGGTICLVGGLPGTFNCFKPCGVP